MLKHSLGHIHRAVVIVAVMLAGMLLLNVGLTSALAQGPGGGSGRDRPDLYVHRKRYLGSLRDQWGTLTLVNPTITRSGDTSSAASSSFYGLNAAVLAGSGSVVTISSGSVTTDGEGTNGVFATGTGSTVTLSDMTIEAVGDGAHAVMATRGGTMILTRVGMVTTDSHSGAIATDRGSGTITVTGGTVLTSGQDSPGIYSTGAIMVSDAVITAIGAESAVIEGVNSITLTDTILSSSIEDKWGVMIYQSFSGDAEGSEGVFSMTGGSLEHTATTGPLFFITNTTAYITLSAVDLTAGSGILVEAGGTVFLTADAQALSVVLQNESSLTGAVNPDNSAQAVTLTLDETSVWNVTADSVLTCLNDTAGISDSTITNIVGNDYTVTYDAGVCTELGGPFISCLPRSTKGCRGHRSAHRPPPR